ncbi:MAG: glycoside hydrolase family 18 protein [Chloroflexi bacterium]|nr:glycoside hydrolase family 18 protein [Chloroflexota bacterium]
MRKRLAFSRMAPIVVLVGVLLSTSPFGLPREATAQPNDSPYRLVGYYPSYGIYEDYFVTDIPATELTHLNYAYIGISDNGQCVSIDPWTDTRYSYPGDEANLRLRGNIRQLQLLRGNHPDLKILMTIGGWNDSGNFSDVALTPAARTRFAQSCVAFMREYLFDGIDIDWRYPVSGGQTDGRPADLENFTLLLAELRAQLDTAGERDGRTYYLSMLAPAFPQLYQNIELNNAHIYLDWINLMTFGFHGEWSELASHHAPLYANTRDPRGEEMQQLYNVDAVVNVFLDAGVPANKLVVGLPFYAQTWLNVRPNDYFGLYQRADGVPAGTRPGGILYYRDMIPLLTNVNYTRFFDDEVRASWLYSAEERIAISYDDAQSLRDKVMYVRQHRLGGVMIWQVSYDDKDNPLLEVVNDALYQQ